MNKDVGDRLKVFAQNFDRKLGEINDYVFNVVGKEVHKNIDQSAEIITKAQSQSITLRRINEDPAMIQKRLKQDHRSFRQKIMDKMYDEELN